MQLDKVMTIVATYWLLYML